MHCITRSLLILLVSLTVLLGSNHLAAEDKNEPLGEITVVAITENDFLQRISIRLETDHAVQLNMPDGKSVCFWKSDKGQIHLGEKPFVPLEREIFTMNDGTKIPCFASYIKKHDMMILSEADRTHFVVAGEYLIELRIASKEQPSVKIEKASKEMQSPWYEQWNNALKDISSESKETRLKALEHLHHYVSFWVPMGQHGNLKYLAKAVRPLASSKDVEIKNAAKQVLRSLRDEETLLSDWEEDELLTLEHPILHAQTYARNNLKYKNSKVTRKVATLLSSQNETVRKCALAYFLIVYDKNNEAAKKAVIAASQKRDKDSFFIQADAIEALIPYLGKVKAKPILMEILNEDDPNVISSAISELTKIGTVESDVFIPFLNHKNSTIRFSACRALKDRTDEETVLALFRATSDKDELVRMVAIEALVEHEAEGAFDRLVKMIREDPSLSCRINIMSCLVNYEKEKSLPILEERLIAEKTDWVQEEIKSLIRKIQRAAETVSE